MSRFINARSAGALLVLVVVVAGWPEISNARPLINVDVDISGNPQTYSGAAAIGSPGDVWNSLATGAQTTATASGLLESDGTSSSVSVTISASDNTKVYAAADFATPDGNLLRDSVRIDGGATGPNLDIEINNLLPNQLYDLYLYSTIAGSYGGKFTFDSTSKSATGASVGETYVENQNYVRFAGINSGTGTITGLLELGPTQIFGVFNGMQIQEVPEPTSLGLVAAAGVLFMRRRRQVQR